MWLGNDEYQQAGVHVEVAQIHFLNAASAREPRILDELYEQIYPLHLQGAEAERDLALANWCRRWHFIYNDQPAAWVMWRGQMTLIWWSRGKPTPQQVMRAKPGDNPVKPLEWWTIKQYFSGMPDVHHEGTSIFDYQEKISIRPRFGETTKLEFVRRLIKERSEAASFRNAAERAWDACRELLVKTPMLPKFKAHLTCAVLFQVCGLEVAQILEDEAFRDADASTIQKGINRVLQMVELTRRPPTNPGRPRKHRKS